MSRSLSKKMRELLEPEVGLSVPINGPNYNELERMKDMHATVVRRLALFQTDDYVPIKRETVEELVQMMSDSLKTAKQLLDHYHAET